MPSGRSASRRQITAREAEEIREDLRGGKRDRVADVAFPLDAPIEVSTLPDVEVSNCKLWLNVGGGLLRRGRLEGCRFHDVELDALRIWKTDVRSTEFESVTIGQQNLGSIRDCTFEKVRFRECRLLDYAFTKSTLQDFSIDGGELEGLRVASCQLTRVRISSDLSDALFKGCDFTETDVSGSEVQDVTFLDWDAADVRLPRNGQASS